MRDLPDDVVDPWVDAAMATATLEWLDDDDPRPWFADCPRALGCWGHGVTQAEALDDLRDCLCWWLHLKVEHGDDDIPSFGGVSFTPAVTLSARTGPAPCG